MASDKTEVIKALFFKYWDPATKTLQKTVMTLRDVSDAIRECNAADGKNRSDRNPANFLKDIVRSRRASNTWPKEVAALGYTGEQRTGEGDSFEFVLYAEGQAEPFPDLYRPAQKTPRIKLQSLSMPLAAKALGRTDEAWLIQTAVNLRVIEQHLAIFAPFDVKQVTHLQMNVKLRATEIDAIYLVSLGAQEALVTCEAKQDSERILIGQISNQVRAAFETMSVAMVIPMAIRSVRNIGIHVLEFESVQRYEALSYRTPILASEAIYELTPPVKGI